ncbi:3-dehydroquinate synthase [Granulosicoccaceae sp. 1_MG-2023]|nr:3-dehydroquinate synthase [Granulosicoccaceae sp. 1_MG-2023]
MTTLNIDLGERSYPIHIGPGLLARPDLLTGAIGGQNVLIVSNETVAPLYLERVKAALGDYNTQTLVLRDGEQYKTLDELTKIYDKLLELRFDRRCTLIALGGGVIGDMTGFAAASYQRGVNFIQIPTTLLAQVDSSVGGKTGVNHPLGKNMIGAFHQPVAVIADTDSLNTLPDRELRAGLAEVIKYGLLIDFAFFEWLEDNLSGLLQRDTATLSHAIAHCCRIKAQVVANDEREKGQRALLNLGHTFGHAIETGMGYGAWLHGEAVGTGMCMAADLSCRLGRISEADRDRAIALIDAAGLPVKAPSSLTEERFLALMSQDKKVTDKTLNLVLFEQLGHTVLTSDFDDAALRATIRAFTAA